MRLEVTLQVGCAQPLPQPCGIAEPSARVPEEAPAEEPEESAAEDEVEETTAELNEKLDNAADASTKLLRRMMPQRMAMRRNPKISGKKTSQLKPDRPLQMQPPLRRTTPRFRA